MYEVASKFSALAANHGIDPVSLAIAWTGSHPGITAPIIGARNKQQLIPCLESVKVDMTEELYNSISALSYTPAPATDRNEEKTEYNYGVR